MIDGDPTRPATALITGASGGMALPKDLSQPGAADDLFAELQWGSMVVDILVNNAGILVYGIFTETDWAREAQMLQLNLVASVAKMAMEPVKKPV